jgi:LmbE family N-acetylglucosaminyl deacetylase
MKKVIFGVFAHPDDEAFGPAGTLLKLKAEGYDIHLILLTDGDAGVNLDNVPDLAATRLTEWRAAARIVGASSTTALHYPDGELQTVPLSDLVTAVRDVAEQQLSLYGAPTEVSCMTFEPEGLTGHRDHIAASQLTTQLASDIVAHEVWYYCLDSTQAPLDGTAYYEPRAREDSYITTRVDVSAYLTDKYRMMDCHYSQRKDAENAKALGDKLLSRECFCITTVPGS